MSQFKSSLLVSVIVPVYNQEKYIGRCLRSLLNQTIDHDKYEIIVVDDGSCDRTPYALDLFHDAIKIITNKVNKGLPASLNTAIKAASGEFIVRVDSDDYVNKNFINFLHFYLDQNPSEDAVGCDYWLFNEKEEWLERVNSQTNPIACGIMFRKHQLIDIGLYDENFLCQEDVDLRVRFTKKYKISHLKLPLYRYRRHDNNLTNNVDDMEAFRKNLIHKHGSEYK